MFGQRQNSTTLARKEVAQWFAQRPTGAVFLPGDGRVLPLGAEEAIAVRAGAEEKAIAWAKALELRAWIAIILVVTIFVGMQSFSSKLEEPWQGGVLAASYAIYTVHGLWILYEVVSTMRDMRTLRASIAYSLAGRVPLVEHLAGDLGKTDPIRYVLIGLVVLLIAWNWLAEAVSHWGIDLIGIIPSWLPLSVVVFVYIAALGSRWIDRQRGIGVLPSEDLTARVRNRLDRERLGG